MNDLPAKLWKRGISDPNVLKAVGRVPRHLFVPEAVRALANQDRPLPIGYAQTISQPFIVGFMTRALEAGPDDRALEIGTGSGYQAAVLSRLVREVYSLEIIPELAASARKHLRDSRCDNVQVVRKDGYRGLPEAAPFDNILITAAIPEIPPPLLAQLRGGGRLVAPVGEPGGAHTLRRIRKTFSGRTREEDLLTVRFVPFTRENPESGE